MYPTKTNTKIEVYQITGKYYVVDGVHLLGTGATSDEKQKEW